MSTTRKRRKRRKYKRSLIYMAVCLVLIAVIIIILCVNSAGKKEEQENTARTDETESSTDTTEAEYTVVIDPGHGFGDVGNIYGYAEQYEYYYTVLYSEALQEKLEAMGINAVLTHNNTEIPDEAALTTKTAEYGITYSSSYVKATAGDNIFDKYERVMWTSILDHEEGVDFFISLHFNSSESGAVNGPSIYYYEGNPYASMLNTFCLNLMSSLGGSADQIYASDYDNAFVVVKYPTYPAVLFEIAYMTNESDAANIMSESYMDSLTTQIAESIVEILKSQE